MSKNAEIPTPHQKPIDVTLFDGLPGLRRANIRLGAIEAFACPPRLLPKLTALRETEYPGVYILWGKDDNGSQLIYIGKSDGVKTRLRNHCYREKLPEIIQLVFFTHQGNKFHPGHVAFLEHQLIECAKKVGRYPMTNDQDPSLKSYMQGEAHHLEETVLKDIYLLTSVLGFDIFEPQEDEARPEANGATEFVYKTPNIQAVGYRKPEGFEVKAGSIARPATSSLKPRLKVLRDTLVATGVLVPTAEVNSLQFARKYEFSSPSDAASIVAGNDKNGRLVWKQGVKSLGEIIEAEKKQNASA